MRRNRKNEVPIEKIEFSLLSCATSRGVLFSAVSEELDGSNANFTHEWYFSKATIKNAERQANPSVVVPTPLVFCI